MKREPKLVINPYYQNAISDEGNSSGFTLENLFVGTNLQIFATA